MKHGRWCSTSVAGLQTFPNMLSFSWKLPRFQSQNLRQPYFIVYSMLITIVSRDTDTYSGLGWWRTKEKMVFFHQFSFAWWRKKIHFKVMKKMDQSFSFTSSVFPLWFYLSLPLSFPPFPFTNCMHSYSQVATTQSTFACSQTFSFSHVLILAGKEQLALLSHPLPRTASPGHLNPKSFLCITECLWPIPFLYTYPCLITHYLTVSPYGANAVHFTM